jgi:RNA polymerase sigma-70 factor (sigma-E family)
MRKPEHDAAFKAFYFREQPRLKQVALLLTGDPEGAADLTQEALLKVYRSWRRIRSDDPGPYARRTLVNLFRNEQRSLSVRRRRAPTAPEEVPAPDAGVAEALRVAEALSVLSPVRRATIVLRFYDDMAEAEIARLLDRPEGTVRSDIHRSLKQLREVLTEEVTL